MKKKKVVKVTEPRVHHVNVTFPGQDRVRVDIAATGGEQIHALAAIFNHIKDGLEQNQVQTPPGFPLVGIGLAMLLKQVEAAEDEVGATPFKAHSQKVGNA